MSSDSRLLIWERYPISISRSCSAVGWGLPETATSPKPGPPFNGKVDWLMRIPVSARDGWRMARATEAQTACRSVGVHTTCALGSYSNPVYALWSNLDPKTNERVLLILISS